MVQPNLPKASDFIASIWEKIPEDWSPDASRFGVAVVDGGYVIEGRVGESAAYIEFRFDYAAIRTADHAGAPMWPRIRIERQANPFNTFVTYESGSQTLGLDDYRPNTAALRENVLSVSGDLIRKAKEAHEAALEGDESPSAN